MDKIEPKINNVTAALMITVAGLIDLSDVGIDLFHFIPVVGNVFAIVATTALSIFAWLTFYTWFKIKGVNFSSPKRALAFNGGFLIELIPVLNALPAWTAAVLIIIGSMRVEEKLAEISPMAAKMAQATLGSKNGPGSSA